jgi:hypothetical protein
MYVASTLVTRNENFFDLVDSGAGAPVTSSRFQELREIHF